MTKMKNWLFANINRFLSYNIDNRQYPEYSKYTNEMSYDLFYTIVTW